MVTLVTPDGAFGGPLRVAVNQAAALRKLGHSVELVAGARGFEEGLPASIDGSTVRLFPARYLIPAVGFAGISAPSMVLWLMRHLREFDIIHVHVARDLVSLPAAALALIAKRPFVLQTHGMIDTSHRRSAHLLDLVVTRRVLRGAGAVLGLTPQEQADLLVVEPTLSRLVIIHNGVPIPSDFAGIKEESVPTERDADVAIVPRRLEVLFLARLHPRKRPQVFVELARRIGPDFPEVAFRLVGPDEGEGVAVSNMIAASPDLDIAWEGPLASDKTADRLRRATVYVLPALNEPFPMSVLEAMASRVPVVITTSCGLAPVLMENKAGSVTDPDVSAMEVAVRLLLGSTETREQTASAGLALLHREFGMDRVADMLIDTYEAASAASL